MVTTYQENDELLINLAADASNVSLRQFVHYLQLLRKKTHKNDVYNAVFLKTMGHDPPVGRKRNLGA